MFYEAEMLAPPVGEQPRSEEITYERRKSSGKRTEDLSKLPVETITYSLEEGEQVCTCCGGSLHEMSTETRNEIAVVPPQVKVIRHVRNVYACRHCDREDIQTPIVTAAMPKPVYPGSLASPSSMAYVMSQKYVDSLPLYRQEVTLVGCWAHARRKYDEALKVAPPTTRGNKNSVANQGLAYCNTLFQMERELNDASSEERYAERKKRSLSILEDYSVWLKQQRSQSLPKSLAGQAITYSLNQWEKLTSFLKDGRIEIDNNRSERSIKPFVIGRKNWLFANTPRGAKASATIYSVIETAKENGLRPFQYLKYLFEQLPQLPDPQNPEALEPFLPWSSSLPITCRVME